MSYSWGSLHNLEVMSYTVITALISYVKFLSLMFYTVTFHSACVDQITLLCIKLFV